MIKKMRIFVLVAVIMLQFIVLQAQQTVWHSDAAALFRKGSELYSKQEYGGATQIFKDFLSKYPDAPPAEKETAKYYLAMSSTALKNPFALQQLTAFAAEYPESSWLPSVSFAMARLFYRKHKYNAVLETLEKVKPSNLTKTERSEYFFMKGFSFMKKNQPENALASFEKSMNYDNESGKAASFYYGHIQYQKGNFDKALKAFEKVENDRRFKKLIPPYYMHIYYQKGDFDRVIKEGQKLYRTADRKSKPELARIIANAWFEKGNFEKAGRYFDDYERSARGQISADEQYRIAWCKFKNGRFKAAIPNFQKAITGNAEFAQNAWYYLGFCYRNTQQNRFAQKAFLKAYRLKKDPALSTDALFAYLKITIEEKGDPYNDPIAILQEYIKTNPTGEQLEKAYDLLVQLYLSSKNSRAALQSIEKSKNPNRILRSTYQKLSYSEGVALYNRNDFKGAVGYFSASLKYPVDDELAARALYWKAEAFYRLRQYPQAREYYKRFLSSPKAAATGLIKQAYYNLAYTWFQLKDYVRAADAFKKVLSFRGVEQRVMQDAQLRLADCYFMSKQFDKALQWYDKAASSGRPDADYALYQKAFCYAAKEDYKQKIATLQHLTGRFPRSSYYDDALYEIATTYSALNDQRNAIVYFDKIVKEKPNSPFAKKALIKMGLVYYKNNQLDRAVSTLKKAVNRYPASHEASVALNTLESIYKDKGEPEKYFAYVKTLDFVQISKSEEDSVTFSMGEEQYLENDCSKAVSSLNRYLKNFSDGGFVLKAHFYLAKCYEKTGDTQEAYNHYQKVLSYPDNEYTTRALLAAARIAYDLKDYQKAFDRYKKLSERAENKSTILEAEDGAMRSAFMMKNYKEADKYARMLLKTPRVSDDQIVYAHYILGKSALEQGNKKEAVREFNITDNLTSGVLGAEAKYRLIVLTFEQGDDKKAENMVYDLSEQYPDFEYWVAKGFILLSDIYVSRKNYFQARETLKSIIENYSGEDLKEVARTKLALIPEEKTGEEQN